MRALLLVVFVIAGCGEARERREWRASDHGQPEASAVDPERMPMAGNGDPAESLFNAMCATCHGREGRGDGPGRPPMAQVQDLSSAAYQASRTDAQIAEVIVRGRNMMPAFGEQLDADAVARLVGYVRRLGPANAPAPAPTPAP